MDEKQKREAVGFAQGLCHHSGKPVNTNATPVGVRVGSEQALDLPYIGVRTLMSEGQVVPIDYINNSANSGHLKRLRMLIGERKPDKESDPDPFDPDILEQYNRIAKTHHEVGTRAVSPRLRQILVPTDEGGYVTLTPLSCAGLSQIANEVADRRQTENATARKEKRSVPHGMDRRVAKFSVGGTNPGNAGGRVTAMRRPYVFDRVPTITAGLRRALSVHHRGFRPAIPREVVRPYAEWLERTRTEGGERPMTRRLADEEARLVGAILKSIRVQADQASALLQEHAGRLPDPPPGGSGTPASVSDGWLTPGLRDPAWRESMAVWLADRLDGYPVTPGSTPEHRLTLSAMDRKRLINLVKEL